MLDKAYDLADHFGAINAGQGALQHQPDRVPAKPAETMSKLRGLQADFIYTSGSV
jgi:hypothetical protein